MRQPTALTKAMQLQHINSPFQLTEFDGWVNDATREDIATLAKQSKVFGLKLWTYKELRGEQLTECYNFDVNYLFKESDHDQVKKLIDDYISIDNQVPRLDQLETIKFLDALGKLTLYSCIWV